MWHFNIKCYHRLFTPLLHLVQLVAIGAELLRLLHQTLHLVPFEMVIDSYIVLVEEVNATSEIYWSDRIWRTVESREGGNGNRSQQTSGL